jgi:hypothetical protein
MDHVRRLRFGVADDDSGAVVTVDGYPPEQVVLAEPT